MQADRYLLWPTLTLAFYLSGCGGGSEQPASASQTVSTSSGQSAQATAQIAMTVGADRQIDLPNRVSLEAVLEGGVSATEARWSLVRGPGRVWFSDSEKAETLAEFTLPGTYDVRATMIVEGRTLQDDLSVEVRAASRLTVREEGSFAIHKGNRASVGPRITTSQGHIYLAFVDKDLKTVVAHKALGESNAWNTGVVEESTKEEENHTKPAIAVDSKGHVHVVYNMHNAHWKYKVSSMPHSVSGWEFRGGTEAVPLQSAIPGQGITYPNFASDIDGNLWLAFRECFTCRIGDMTRRGWASGLVKYDVATRTWSRVGGAETFAKGDPEGYRPQYLTPWVDHTGKLHLGWIWGKQYTNVEGSVAFFQEPTFPAYAASSDGGATFQSSSGNRLALPVSFSQSDIALDSFRLDASGGRMEGGYFTEIGSVTAEPTGRAIVTSKGTYSVADMSGGWSHLSGNVTTLPRMAKILRVNRNGDYIAVSGVNNGLQGVVVHRSRDQGRTWARWEIDSSQSDNELLNPEYYLDDTYFLNTGQLRLALKYTRAAGSKSPIVKVLTVHLPPA